MSRRVSLGDLAEKSSAAVTTPAAQTPTAVEAPAEPAAEPAPKRTASRPKAPAKRKTTTPTAPEGWQRFDAYERKEARLRPDQYGQLSDLARSIMRSRTGRGGERITENTLIRVAIDLLLARSDDLSGTTEAELRRSLGL